MTTSRANESFFYTACVNNCGGGSCVLKVHVGDGAVVNVEADDRYNPGVGREDAVLSEEDLLKGRVQSRPCPKAFVFHKACYSADRVIYPLKRAPGSRRGEGKFVKISWEEALGTIAEKMKEARAKYGPYSITTARSPGPLLLRLYQLWGAGIEPWGYSSYDATSMMAHLMAGDSFTSLGERGSSSAADMMANSRLIVVWGLDPAVTVVGGPSHQLAWWIKLCRERGKQVVIIDPRYTASAEVLADQWIPIKPGTDLAMFLGMAHVLLKEDLWDKVFVSKYVEAAGFEKWKNYVLGQDDGVEKSPEWAEGICAVPAGTVRALARLVATTRPAWLWYAYAINRRSHGEQTIKAFAALQAMLGYWGAPGGGPPFFLARRSGIPARVSSGPAGAYQVPKGYRGHNWDQAILLLDKVRNGELSAADYVRMVGWKSGPSVLKDFHPRVLLWSALTMYDCNYLVTTADSVNDGIRALEKMDFIASLAAMITPTAKYADIILPTFQRPFEKRDIAKSDRRGWASVSFMPGLVESPGEVKPDVWIHVKLAEKLGIDPGQYFRYYTTDENWDADWERYLKDCYQEVVSYYRKRNIDVPAWAEFTSGKFINCDELDEPYNAGYAGEIKAGAAFKTESGRIEIYSRYVADADNRGKGEHLDSLGRPYYHLPGDWGDMLPMPVYRPPVRGMDDPLVKEYPLMLLTPHSRYRIHSWLWDGPWLKDHVYQHRVWISPADAGARGIKDGDLVAVYNDRGKVVMPAYVTSRILPGVAVLHHGGKYLPDESGVDRGATPATLLGGDFQSCVTPAKATTVVQIEKFGGER
ncbi:MAG: molybdopterin-dependent oxidoreductase [Chloroflexi bacterium]|nr:molybdopterin-dependent oxidoreductase [Chloroflexota bacterium]